MSSPMLDMPEHFPIGVDAHGQGPADQPHHVSCWCPDGDVCREIVTDARPWTVGVVGHGVSDMGGHMTRPDRCADEGHPGVTYNPWQDRTWCLCGDVITDGDTVTWPKADDCPGPLSVCNDPRCPTRPIRAEEKRA